MQAVTQSEFGAHSQKGRHSRGSHASSKRGNGSGPQGDPQKKSPQTGIFIGFNSQPEAVPNLTKVPTRPNKDVHNKFIDRQMGDAQKKTPQTGWFMGFNSQPEAAPNLTKAPTHPNKDVHNKFINRQVTRAAELGDMSKLFEVISSHAAEMNGINLATAFHRVAKLSSVPGTSAAQLQAVKANPCFVALLADISRHISGHRLLHRRSRDKGTGHRPELLGEMPVQCLSIVAWSCATLRIRNNELFAQIAAIVEPNLGQLKSFELSNLLWAYAKLHLNAAELFSTAADHLLNRKEGEYKVQCLSTIAWCFATLQCRNTAVFKSLAKELAAYSKEAKPQEISTTLWAFAKNRHSNSTLFEVFGQAALTDGKIWQFKLQELSNTAWAFATAGLQNNDLFEKIEHVARSKMPEMESQSIANITWAFAKLQAPLRTDLIPTLLNMTLTRQEKFKPQELSAVMWAASQICPDNTLFFDAAVRICVQRLGQFSANAVANLVKTLSTVRTDDPSLFVAILQENVRRLPQVPPQSLCNALHGSAHALARFCSDLAMASPDHSLDREAIGKATSDICNHIATRTDELRQVEAQQISITLHEHRACLNMSTAQALERALAERTGIKTFQSEQEKSDRCGHDSEDWDLVWPTSRQTSSDGCVGVDALPEEVDLTLALQNSMTLGEGCAGIDALPEKVDLTSTLQGSAPLGNTLASLAQGPGSGKPTTKLDDFTHQNLIAQVSAEPPNFSHLPPQGFDEMPWKVPLPSDEVSAPWVMQSNGPSNYAQFPYNPQAAEAILVASLQAMFAAATATAAAGQSSQSSYPRSVSGASYRPGHAQAARRC